MKQAEFTRIIDSLASRGTPFAVATVVKTEGSSIGKPGFKVVISSSGEVLYGTLGGACPESAIAASAKKAIGSGTPRVVKVFLENVEGAVGAAFTLHGEDEIHVETNCGGTMEVYVEPFLPTQRLILIGQGGKDDVEEALVRLGKSLDFEVVVINHAPELGEQPDRVIQDPDFDLGSFGFSPSDSVVVLTKGERDVPSLLKLSSAKLRYVGLLASGQRARETVSKVRSLGVSEEFVLSLRSPIGADIGAVTPGEIALSIMAEIVAAKYGKGVPRKQTATDNKRELDARAG